MSKRKRQRDESSEETVCAQAFFSAGGGWARWELELPISVAERYATRKDQPDMKPIALAKMVAFAEDTER